jgi:hypothetical protein
VTWTKIDDSLASHPKVCAAGNEAMGLWVRALAHCGAYLTDGVVTDAVVTAIVGSSAHAKRLGARLVAAGLWEPLPNGSGWRFHDFLAYNPSRDEVLSERDRKRKAGLASAAKRWGTPRSSNSSGNTCYPSATDHSIGSRDAPDPVPDPSPPRSLGEPPSGLLRSPETPPGGARRSSTKTKTEDRGTRLLEDWTPSDAVVAWAAKEHGVDALACLDEFRDYWRAVPGAKGRKTNWNATLRNRIRELVAKGRAPLLPPPEYSPPATANGDPAQAREVARIVADLRKAKSPAPVTGGRNAT